MSQHKPSVAAIGLSVFAAVILIVVGIFQFIAGFTAVAKDDVAIYTGTGDNTYVLSLDTTQWGWIHLVLGVVIFFAGVGLMFGQTWARVVGVTLASISAVVNFAFIPIYPVWAIMIIALDVAVIWALTAHGRDISSDQY